MELRASGSAEAHEMVRKGKRMASSDVTLSANVGDVARLSEDAQDRIHRLLRRESERIAQIVAVDLRDQELARREAERLRGVPKDRPSIIVAAGTKDRNAVQVVRGEYEVMGRRMAASQGEDR